MNLKIAVLSCCLCFSYAAFAGGSKRSAPEPPSVVESVDLEKYLGKWFEVARLPNKFQKGCFKTTATYTLKEKNKIEVLNQCTEADGSPDKSTGTAWSANAPKNSKLEVQFFWPFTGDYWILDLEENYEWALVGTPDYKYLWILARSIPMDTQTLQKIINIASQKGYETDNLVFDPYVKLR